MIIQNEELKDILVKKGEVVQKGRDLNAKLDAKVAQIVLNHLLSKGIKNAGLDGETQLFTGNYQQLLDLFGTNGQVDINTLVEKECEAELQELKTLEYQVQKYSEQAYPIIEELTTYDLEEFEEVGTVELKGEDIHIEVYNVVDEFKKRYTQKHANEGIRVGKE